jgi:hypothetical protein
MNDRDLFRSLRDDDAARAPSFAATLRAARAVRPEPVSLLPALAAVAAGLVLALTVVSRVSDDGSLQAAIARAQDISSWSAPTAVFLDLDDNLLDTTPTLTLSSVALPE